MKKKLHQYIVLFITFFKIGLFTFGGGYAMIPLIQEEVVDKHKWMKQDEIFEILIVSESTPGPMSINVATFVGFRTSGIFGAIISTLGLITPSLIIISLISLIINDFLKIEIISKAFSGIKVGVIVLLISALAKLMKGSKTNLKDIIVFSISLALLVILLIFPIDFPYINISFILFGLVTGLISTFFINRKRGNK